VCVHLASPGFVDTRIYRDAIYRGTNYEDNMRRITALGFPMISAGRAAASILAGVRRGRRAFAFPWYAALLHFLAPRIPCVVNGLHRSMIRSFRHSAAAPPAR
jgi:hypothetical protein